MVVIFDHLFAFSVLIKIMMFMSLAILLEFTEFILFFIDSHYDVYVFGHSVGIYKIYHYVLKYMSLTILLEFIIMC
jgi:hypothetical protein